MTLGKNPFKRPPIEPPPEEERPPVTPPITGVSSLVGRPSLPTLGGVPFTPVDKEIPEFPLVAKDPFTGKDVDLTLKQGIFLWKGDELEGFFKQDGTFITTKPEEASFWEKTGAFLSGVWQNLPVNPYFWKSPSKKWEADRRDALEAWAKESGQENPKEFVEDLLAKESGELAFQAFEPEEGALRIPVSGVGPTGILPHQVPATRFLGEWVIPAAILGGLGISAIKARAALAPVAARGGVTGALAVTGRVVLAPPSYLRVVSWEDPSIRVWDSPQTGCW